MGCASSKPRASGPSAARRAGVPAQASSSADSPAVPAQKLPSVAPPAGAADKPEHTDEPERTACGPPALPAPLRPPGQQRGDGAEAKASRSPGRSLSAAPEVLAGAPSPRPPSKASTLSQQSRSSQQTRSSLASVAVEHAGGRLPTRPLEADTSTGTQSSQASVISEDAGEHQTARPPEKDTPPETRTSQASVVVEHAGGHQTSRPLEKDLPPETRSRQASAVIENADGQHTSRPPERDLPPATRTSQASALIELAGGRLSSGPPEADWEAQSSLVSAVVEDAGGHQTSRAPEKDLSPATRSNRAGALIVEPAGDGLSSEPPEAGWEAPSSQAGTVIEPAGGRLSSRPPEPDWEAQSIHASTVVEDADGQHTSRPPERDLPPATRSSQASALIELPGGRLSSGPPGADWEPQPNQVSAVVEDAGWHQTSRAPERDLPPATRSSRAELPLETQTHRASDLGEHAGGGLSLRPPGEGLPGETPSSQAHVDIELAGGDTASKASKPASLLLGLGDADQSKGAAPERSASRGSRRLTWGGTSYKDPSSDHHLGFAATGEERMVPMRVLSESWGPPRTIDSAPKDEAPAAEGECWSPVAMGTASKPEREQAEASSFDSSEEEILPTPGRSADAGNTASRRRLKRVVRLKTVRRAGADGASNGAALLGSRRAPPASGRSSRVSSRSGAGGVPETPRMSRTRVGRSAGLSPRD
ncbi:unnamed protein product [Prorocentrum cordatum]|uniref:Uncharacterized protein n=1 Tax=Prorocentrum cordatum TaxID=2364126 RepID=A0ABN9XUL4_9DINO|nr:unnamed protein product [Polarella glacialis]